MQLVPAYLPSIAYMAQFLIRPVCFTLLTNYQKQTYRNRCSIHGANWKLNLIIPVEHHKTKAHVKDNEVCIKWDENWQKQHWKSITSAYRSSPFFEFYEDELSAVFFLQPRTLAEFNLALLSCLSSWLEIEDNFLFAKSYTALTHKEEKLLNPKQEIELAFPKYIQVFNSKHGFLPNLSILDLIFNLGPESHEYLKHVVSPSPNE